MAIIDFFDRGWSLAPEAIAYVQGEREYTYGAVGELSCKLANALLGSGLSQGAHGAVWAGNDVTAWACTLGLWRANMVWIPVGVRNPAEMNARQLHAFDCDVLFFHSDYADEVASVQSLMPRVTVWVCIDDEVAQVDGAVSLDAWVASQPTTMPEASIDLDDVVMISPTGGTTGEPKGVMNTHRSLQTFCAHYMMACTYDADDPIVNLAAAPMTHTAGVLTLPTSARGGTVVVLTTPDPELFLDAVARHSVTEVFLPPTVIYRLLDIAGRRPGADFASLRYFLYGAAPMSVSRLKEAMRVFGPCMMGGYGQTEAPASISFFTPSEHRTGNGAAPDSRLGSVGRPNPLVRVAIRDDDDADVPAGTTGEICVRGDLVMKGYYKAPELTAEVIVDGWLHTGDIGHLDADGYLHITDRKKDMIISGGFNVYPSEIEQVLWSHPSVRDCAVIGVLHPEWGEAVTAVVEPHPGKDVDVDELIALCRDQLGPVRTPKSIEVVSALPRSPIGKVLKKDLRETYWRGTGRSI